MCLQIAAKPLICDKDLNQLLLIIVINNNVIELVYIISI